LNWQGGRQRSEVTVHSSGIGGDGAGPAIACELAGDEVSGQAERWARLAREAGLGRAETGDGLRLRFRDEPAVEQELRALAAAESRCCSWARWEVGRAEGGLVLQVSSTPEGAAALHAMFRTGEPPKPGA
jgi:hypothetical protein